MMKDIFLVCLLFMTVLNVQAQEEIQDFRTFRPEGMKCVEGVLPLYYKDKNVYLEIGEKLLGREFLITAQIRQGFGKRARWLQTPGVFRLVHGEKGYLWLQYEVLAERITGKDLMLANMLEAGSLQPVAKKWPIVAVREDRKGYIADISEVLKGNDDWFVCTDPEVKGVEKGSFELLRATALTDGVALDIKGWFGYSPSQQAAISMLSGSGYLPMEICCVLKVLPDRDLPIRYADSRIPFRSICFTEYGENPYGAVRDSIIERWKMERPLVCRIDSCCPPEWIKYIRAAVSDWNKVFRAAGFRQDMLLVKAGEEGICLPAERLVIAYDLGKPEVKAEWKVNRRTGEIVAGRIYIGHGFAWQQRWKYRMRQNETRETDKEVMDQILKAGVFRAIGTLLGLKPEVAESGPGPAVSLAVAWGYQECHGNKDAAEERYLLCRWLEKQQVKSETDFAKLQGKEDLRHLETGMENLTGFYRKIEKVVYPQGMTDCGSELRAADRQGRELYADYLMKAVELTGREKVPLQEGMDFLRLYLFDFEPRLLTSPFLSQNPERNPVALSAVAQPVFEKLLSPEILNPLIVAGRKSGACPVRELFEALDRVVFKSWQADRLNAWQLEMQTACLKAFRKCIRTIEVEKAATDYALKMLSEHRRLKAKIKEAKQAYQGKQPGDFYEMLWEEMR